ncbi:LCP family protein [Candidatus Dojkabacteria bacterium]|nr:LCP family protein [Candidatus Dojkabacteria bacterium]
MKKINLKQVETKPISSVTSSLKPVKTPIIKNNSKREPGKFKQFFSRLFKKKWFIPTLIVLSIPLIYFGIKGFVFFRDWYDILKGSGLELSWEGILEVLSNNPVLETDEFGRTNVLIVGIDTRPNGEYSNTDTIMIASYDRSTQEAYLISIPRDTVVQFPDRKEYYARINTMYITAMNIESEKTGKPVTDIDGSVGLSYLAAAVENYIGIHIHYGAVVNLQGAADLINAIGGVDVDVENSFTDYEFPTYNGGYETISFTAGLTHMDGETAVKFARSRHGAWPEGSDFARGRRQQKIIDAVRYKLESDKSLLNASTLWEIVKAVGKNIKLYNVTLPTVESAVQIALTDGIPQTTGIVLDPSIGNYTILREGSIPIMSDQAYIISPTPLYYDYTNVQDFVRAFIEDPELINEKALIYVYNSGVGYSEAYQIYSDLLTEYKYNKFVFIGYYGATTTGITIVENENALAPATISSITNYLTEEGYSVNETNEFELAPLYVENISIFLGTNSIAIEE